MLSLVEYYDLYYVNTHHILVRCAMRYKATYIISYCICVHVCFFNWLVPFFQLREKLQKVNFILDGKRKFFDKKGDFEDGYDVIMWVPDGEHRRAEVKGSFTIQPREVVVNSHDIIWTSTPNNTVCTNTIQPRRQSLVHLPFHCSYTILAVYILYYTLLHCTNSLHIILYIITLYQ